MLSHCTLTVLSHCTFITWLRSHFAVNLLCSQCAFTVLQCELTLQALCGHCTLTALSLCSLIVLSHCTLTGISLCSLTVRSLYAHCTLTALSLCSLSLTSCIRAWRHWRRGCGHALAAAMHTQTANKQLVSSVRHWRATHQVVWKAAHWQLVASHWYNAKAVKQAIGRLQDSKVRFEVMALAASDCGARAAVRWVDSWRVVAATRHRAVNHMDLAVLYAHLESCKVCWQMWKAQAAMASSSWRLQVLSPCLLSMCSLTVLSHCALSLCSLTVLSHRALSLCSFTVLFHCALSVLSHCDVSMWCLTVLTHCDVSL